MCSAFTPDCEYDNSIFGLIVDVYFPNTNCSGDFGLHKKTFQSLGSSGYQCSQCASVYQVGDFPFQDQTIFSLSFGQGVHFFEESLIMIQGFIGDVFCPGKYCSERNANRWVVL